ncbi:MAG: hypothetical protein ACTSWY_13570 [Promethearchaeota archaeon]
MKETEILSLDKRGRIVIPRIMRKSLGLTENTQIMAISDSEAKEIRLVPLQLMDNRSYIKIKITLKDEPGSLGKVADAFGELNLSLIYGESIIIKKKIEAEWTVIAPTPPPELPLEDLKRYLIEHGGALRVKILAKKFYKEQDI